MAQSTVRGAAEDRFRANFGSPRCETCEGLKAGPGVVATCFQKKQCYFGNFKDTDLSPKQRGVIDSLMGDSK